MNASPVSFPAVEVALTPAIVEAKPMELIS